MNNFKRIASTINTPVKTIKTSNEYYNEMMNEIFVDKYKNSKMLKKLEGE
jgi:tRNA U34 2-thiouridine synthase MnmA/TrmU